MTTLDIILIVILSGFVSYGLFFGLIRTFGAFLGMVVGAVLASNLYLPASEWLSGLFHGYANLSKVIVFILLFTLINRLVGFAFYLLDRAFNILSIIPFLKSFNRIGGMALGFLTGALTLGLLLFLISKYAVLEGFFGRWLQGSQVTPWLISFADFIMPLLPEVFKRVQALV